MNCKYFRRIYFLSVTASFSDLLVLLTVVSIVINISYWEARNLTSCLANSLLTLLKSLETFHRSGDPVSKASGLVLHSALASAGLSLCSVADLSHVCICVVDQLGLSILAL